MLPFTTTLILWAMFLQVFLTIFVLFRLGMVRKKALDEKAVTWGEIATNHSAWPEYVLKVYNNFVNQFELPVVFYAGVLTALVLNQNSWIVVILCWVFVLSRWVHMFVHTGSNYIPHRYKIFLIGLVALVLLWIYLAVKVTFSF